MVQVDLVERLHATGFTGNRDEAVRLLQYIGLQSLIAVDELQAYTLRAARFSSINFRGLPDQDAAANDIPDWEEFVVAAALLGNECPTPPQGLKRVFQLRRRVHTGSLLVDLAERARRFDEEA